MSALEAFEASRTGCVLLDVRMPGMKGFELLDSLDREEMPLPIIIMSAYGDVPIVVHAMRAGTPNFLEKPCRDQQLWEAIQEALCLDDDRRRQDSRSANSHSAVSNNPRPASTKSSSCSSTAGRTGLSPKNWASASARSPPFQDHAKNEGDIAR